MPVQEGLWHPSTPLSDESLASAAGPNSAVSSPGISMRAAMRNSSSLHETSTPLSSLYPPQQQQQQQQQGNPPMRMHYPQMQPGFHRRVHAPNAMDSNAINANAKNVPHTMNTHAVDLSTAQEIASLQDFSRTMSMRSLQTLQGLPEAGSNTISSGAPQLVSSASQQQPAEQPHTAKSPAPQLTSSSQTRAESGAGAPAANPEALQRPEGLTQSGNAAASAGASQAAPAAASGGPSAAGGQPRDAGTARRLQGPCSLGLSHQSPFLSCRTPHHMPILCGSSLLQHPGYNSKTHRGQSACQCQDWRNMLV